MTLDAGEGSSMQKVIYFFHRKEGLTRHEFFEHYLQRHSLIALRVTRTMDGYAVNLCDDLTDGTAFAGWPGGPDAITEVWTPDAEAFMGTSVKFDTEEDARELREDDRSFIGSRFAWAVSERLVSGALPGGELRTRTPGVKRVSVHVGDSRPPAAPGVTCVVEHEILHAFSSDSPSVDRIVFEWAPAASEFPPVDGPAWIVSEYRQRDA
jgi:hypothetical protein